MCFNVRKSYGFFHRNDQDTNIFVQTAITIVNLNKILRSLAQGEVVQFDIVMGIKKTLIDSTYQVQTANQVCQDRL